MRPLVHPALALVWRDSTTVQIGLDPARAVVLAGLGPAEVAVLRSMDGVRDVAALRAAAERVGGSAAAADRLVEILDGAGVLIDGDRVRLADAGDALAPDRASRGLLGAAVGSAEAGRPERIPRPAGNPAAVARRGAGCRPDRCDDRAAALGSGRRSGQRGGLRADDGPRRHARRIERGRRRPASRASGLGHAARRARPVRPRPRPGRAGADGKPGPR